MNHMTIDFAPSEEDIFAFGFSDEAIEAAAGMGSGAEDEFTGQRSAYVDWVRQGFADGRFEGWLIECDGQTAWVEAGMTWHQVAEALRPRGLDYTSAPLNMLSTVGGTLGVGGIDVNSPRHGCSADQVVEIEVVTLALKLGATSQPS